MNFYESPVFIDVLLISIYVMLTFTLSLTGWSMIHSMRLRKNAVKDKGIPAKAIAGGVFAVLLFTLVITGLMADTTPITINGKLYDNTLWLRISDVLIYTSAILIVLAVGCIITGIIWTKKR